MECSFNAQHNKSHINDRAYIGLILLIRLKWPFPSFSAWKIITITP